MARHPLKLGYKASAEQFGPRDLLDFTVLAEESGFLGCYVVVRTRTRPFLAHSPARVAPIPMEPFPQTSVFIFARASSAV